MRKQRFEREAKTISSLNHPHICTLYDVGQQDGVDFLVMECVEGETLSKRLEKGPLSLELVLKLGAQIADALYKAHRAGIVHRDLKPDNIMITPIGAKLLDFGLAKPAVPASGMTLTAAPTQTTPVTQEGTVVGTFQYMSPEQIEGKELDGRSDIFSNESNAVYAPPGYLLFVRQETLLAQQFDANKLQASGEAVPLTKHNGADAALRRGNFSVSENGILVYASGSLSEARLLWFDRSGKQLAETGTADVYGFPRISPDGRKLAVPRVSDLNSSSIWIFDLDRATSSRLTFAAGRNDVPVWSPDGKSIVFTFASTQTGKRQIFQQAADGTGTATPLTLGDPDETMPSWSFDGRYVFFQKRPNQGKSPWEILAEPLFADRKTFPVVESPQFLEGDPSLSPDGKWLAHDSDESGRIEVYLAPFLQGGGKWQVSASGGTCPRWRADGHELLYMSLDNKIMSAEISEQASTVVIGKVQPLFQSNPVPSAPECMYDVTADGKRFVVVTVAEDQGVQPLTLAVNWPTLLKKQR